VVLSQKKGDVKMVTWTNHNRAVCLIPTRMDSTRFPGKPLADIQGKPLIQRCYESAKAVACQKHGRQKLCLKEIFLVVDDESHYRHLGLPMLNPGGDFICGTDRVAEAARMLVLPDEEIVLNIQGDNPHVDPRIITGLLDLFDDPAVRMATVGTSAFSSDLADRNMVKVYVKNGWVKHFARSRIKVKPCVNELEHIGIYAYRNSFLQMFSKMPPASRELRLCLEQLRVADRGHRIRVYETDLPCKSVNVPGDLEYFKERMTA
jgi:3-deoxy-manno-octulosonate cytidylyltransferase (CMP-KDO synthetase)